MPILVCAILYLLFVIYGSLVPLDFRPLSMRAALHAFSTIPYLQLNIGSRADWVANILLFVPLAYIWCAALWPYQSVGGRWVVVVVVGLSCCALAFAIEFTQLFFPQRTVSINDIVAECAGGLIGISFWCLTWRKFAVWLASLKLARGTAGVAEKILVIYLFVLFVYAVMPLDITISPVELFHKWNERRIVLIPFSWEYVDRAHQVYDLASSAALWVVPAFLWRTAYRQPSLTIWMNVVVAATTIEILQLFVYSRVTNTTDIFTAAIGAAIGTTLAGKSGARTTSVPWPWIAALAWLVVLAVVFWYPFDFNFDRTFVRERLLSLKRVPFETYYFGSEFRALTEVLHKVGFMLPLGVILGWISSAVSAQFPRVLTQFGSFIFIFGTACMIEGGQIFLPGKFADLTDCLLESFGGFLGYGIWHYASARLNHAAVELKP